MGRGRERGGGREREREEEREGGRERERTSNTSGLQHHTNEIIIVVDNYKCTVTQTFC